MTQPTRRPPSGMQTFATKTGAMRRALALLHALGALCGAGAVAADPPRPAGNTSASPVEVVVQGKSPAERLRESAEAVKVVETKAAKTRSADLGDVLARTQGVSVQRSGGLGSDARFSLNGLTDDQIRFFLDGVPLELSGYPFGVANVPVDLVKRVEIHSGVVPVRLGSDALGGAVNLVTDQELRGTHAAGSLEVGSYGALRATATARQKDESTGLFWRASGFADGAKNHYPIDVKAADRRGRLHPASVFPFHAAYAAGGASLEGGLVDRPWARRLLLRGFATGWERQYPGNRVMTLPYGGVSYGEATLGGTLRYDHVLWHRLSVGFVGGHAYTRGRFEDIAPCVYDWYGRCVLAGRTTGETDNHHHRQITWENATFARLNLKYRAGEEHSLRLNLSPTFTTRTGDERFGSSPNAHDPLAAKRNLYSEVLGLEYAAEPLGGALQSIVFGKHYLQLLRSEEAIVGSTAMRRRDRDTGRFGVGNELRYRLTSFLWLKAAYEYATRLPRPDEVFGDNALVHANLDLEPETSENVNLGVGVSEKGARVGELRAEVTAFLRDAKQLILLLGNEKFLTYQNVYGARSLGFEAAAGWTSAGDYLALDGNLTYQDFRNTSTEGTFGAYSGARVPNRPWFFANGAARAQLRNVVRRRDELALHWGTHYVLGFFRSWETLGIKSSKQTVPSQLVHDVALTYGAHSGNLRTTTSFEAQNLTNRKVYDFYGIQRPGRTLFTKLTLEH